MKKRELPSLLTVGELIDALQKLDRSLPVVQDSPEGIIELYNCGQPIRVERVKTRSFSGTAVVV